MHRTHSHDCPASQQSCSLARVCSLLTCLVSAGGKGELLIPKEEVAKVLKQKTLGPTGMKGLAAIKNVVEKWSASALYLVQCTPQVALRLAAANAVED